jgi:hypothetical protein
MRKKEYRSWPILILFQHFAGATEKTHETLGNVSRCPDLKFHPTCPGFEAGQQRSLVEADNASK